MKNTQIDVIREYIYDLKKYKVVKTMIFDSIYSIIGNRPDKIYGRGQDIQNIMKKFSESLSDGNYVKKDDINLLVNIIILSSDLIMIESKSKDVIFHQCYDLLKSAEYFAEQSDIDIMINYYRKFLKIRLYINKKIEWDTYPDEIKKDDFCLSIYLLSLYTDNNVSEEKLFHLLNNLIQSKSNMIKSIALCIYSYIKAFTNFSNDFIISKDIKDGLKKSRKIISFENEDILLKKYIIFLDTLMINQNKLFFMNNKHNYNKFKNKLLYILNDLKESNMVMEIIILLNNFIIISMNHYDFEFTKYLIEVYININDSYKINFSINKKKLWEAIYGIVYTSADIKYLNNTIDIKPYKTISNDYYYYLKSLPDEIYKHKNSYYILMLGEVYESFSTRPKLRLPWFKVVRRFLIKYVKIKN